MKQNFDYYKFFGLEFKFLAQSLEFLKNFLPKYEDIKFEVLLSILKTALNVEIHSKKDETKFSFISDIKKEIINLNDSNKKNESIKLLNYLFEGSVIDFKILFKNLSNEKSNKI